ncbi:hypothetical protein DID77_01040 [Candidatus Marinamargulisbacteria bacterium SCGC AG-439-L15]|nr:hypothetical protein DID77_01040 [Candidatus Marinamargulisbacteria bacterium SCGC AG-439-L15]
MRSLLIGIFLIFLNSFGSASVLSYYYQQSQGLEWVNILSGETLVVRVYGTNENGLLTKRAKQLVSTLKQLRAIKASLSDMHFIEGHNSLKAVSQGKVVFELSNEDLMGYQSNSFRQLATQWGTSIKDAVTGSREFSPLSSKWKRPKYWAYRRGKWRDGLYTIVYPKGRIGDRVRVLNPKTRWSIVARVVSAPHNLKAESVLLSDAAAEAIGLGVFPEPVQIEEVRE